MNARRTTSSFSSDIGAEYPHPAYPRWMAQAPTASPSSAGPYRTGLVSTFSGTLAGRCCTWARRARCASAWPATSRSTAPAGPRTWCPRSRTSSSSPPRPRPRRCRPSRSSSSATGPSSSFGCATTSSTTSASASTRTSRASTSARAPSQEPRLLRPVQQRQARARDARPARQGLHAPHLRRPAAGPRLRQPLPGLLHQALPGALRRLHLEGGVPRVRRDDHRFPLGPLPPHREGRSTRGCGRRPRSRNSSRPRSSATS